MPETEYEMLSRSRMNTNIEFYYSGFRLDVTYNNGQTQSNANIINPQQAQLAYCLNNVDKDKKSTLSVMLIMHIPCEDFKFIEDKNSVANIWSKQSYAIVKDLSFEFENKNERIEIISNNTKPCNSYKFMYKFADSDSKKETYIIGVESIFNITDDDCKKLLEKNTPKPNNTCVTITIANENRETITFKNTILCSAEVLKKKSSIHVSKIIPSIHDSKIIPSIHVFEIIPSIRYIALLNMFNDAFRVSPVPPVDPVPSVAPVQTTQTTSTPTHTSNTQKRISSSINTDLHKLIIYTYIYYKLTLFPKADKDEYIIYLEIAIDKKNKSNPEKLRIYYIQQKQQKKQKKQKQLHLTFSLDFDYYISNNAFANKYLKPLMLRVGIHYNKIIDDAKKTNNSAKSTQKQTNAAHTHDTQFKRASNVPKKVAKFQKQKYGQRSQQDIQTLSPLITLAPKNIFMFNIDINTQHNNTYLGEMGLQTVNNAPASNLVKNAQDFIVLLKAICAINLYIEKKPILIDLTIKNNDDTKKKQLKIELMDATKGKEEIDKITK